MSTNETVESQNEPFNKLSIVILLVYNTLVVLWIPIPMLLYMCCKHCYEFSNRLCTKCCFETFLPYCFKLAFYAVFGDSKQEVWDQQHSSPNVKNSLVVWIITLSVFAPVFSISSHIGFILVAWLTNGPQASSVALIALAILLYFFFMFRQCYMTNRGVNHSCCPCCLIYCTLLYPIWQCLYYIGVAFYIASCHCCSRDDCQCARQYNCSCCTHNEESSHLTEQFKRKTKDDRDSDEDKFDTKAFCIAFVWGLPLVIPVVLVIVAFVELPIVAFSLLSELFTTIEVFIILISLLITYKILTLNEPDISCFLQKVRNTFIAKSDKCVTISNVIEDKDNYDEVEAAASLVGELAEVVVHRLSRERLHPENPAQLATVGGHSE